MLDVVQTMLDVIADIDYLGLDTLFDVFLGSNEVVQVNIFFIMAAPYLHNGEKTIWHTVALQTLTSRANNLYIEHSF